MKIKVLVLAAILSIVVACGQSQNDNYEVRDYQGEKVIVIKDDDGSDLFLNYLMYKSLIDSGRDVRYLRTYHRQQLSNPTYVQQYNTVKQKVVVIKPTIVEKKVVPRSTPVVTSPLGGTNTPRVTQTPKVTNTPTVTNSPRITQTAKPSSPPTAVKPTTATKSGGKK